MALAKLDQLKSSLYYLTQAASALALVAVLNNDARSERLVEAVRTITDLHQEITLLMEDELHVKTQPY